ncbi:hypothetical protein HJG60_008044 [Phyllostomus discolor]|uniref:Secreted protein n=1 Tax=Phyllostomus discolor TaxID=89673 RepID=A0A834BLJ7_9CHIR|nr:hypothetical protein HJG60_008044 [Phyllostomus discolor]
MGIATLLALRCCTMLCSYLPGCLPTLQGCGLQSHPMFRVNSRNFSRSTWCSSQGSGGTLEAGAVRLLHVRLDITNFITKEVLQVCTVAPFPSHHLQLCCLLVCSQCSQPSVPAQLCGLPGCRVFGQ